MMPGPAQRDPHGASSHRSPPRALVAAGVLLTGAAVVGCPKGGGTDPAVVATIKQMEIVHGQIAIWARENHRAPTAEQGLEAVFDGQVPLDAWGRELLYVVPGPNGWAFDLVSFGSDGERGGRGSAADLVWSELSER